ncbi:3',5'-cyclic-nucleotide phosphodiesterase PDE1 [Paracoccidioides brasiliensis Pb18]|uniref:3',5'-cyclic-nucleotide phosphodiesterase n=1 Tax=Paracoccidioides brasiliensis (strain Pb18) TaxID=502780 RepID=C1GHS7_PARBD|nr:3',5'-cyclic-nucleotide phosphodiesterase PDE1 [Paracoccidioides brasiliensis Pb18]EEH50734.1 hypothetical protein PADG_06813 [Paracoccidioides brasiliensis Pb18]ODH47628.1 hypothetical protein GX48_06245 [Paracoccidioides brasiliensis]
MHRDGGRGRRTRRSRSVEDRQKGAFHVIVLGATGGPREDIITGLLVRSTATNWSAGSVIAIDAGTLLGGIIRVLETSDSVKVEGSTDVKMRIIDGPFAGLRLPSLTAGANAAYIFREIISSIFITHPHLDHIAGLAMNTPLVEAQSNPKIVGALPSTIAAIKNHIFNDITWPNLSDEDGGAGLVTYQRLVDGGNPRLGRGDGRGYVRACEGIVTKCLSVSHGRCRQRYHPETGKHHRAESTIFTTDPVLLPSRRVSIDTQDLTRSYTPTHQVLSSGNSNGKDMTLATVESSAYFLRDDYSGTEIIVFGDIEPDSLSLEPRNGKVWDIAAPKLANGTLRAIFVECSFPDSIDDNYLYGHLCPRHLIAELEALASRVIEATKSNYETVVARKRKRPGSVVVPDDDPSSPKTVNPFSQGRRRTSSPTSCSRRRTRQSSSGDQPLPLTAHKTAHGQSTTPPPSGSPMDDDRVTPETSSVGESVKCRRSSWSVQKPLSGLGVYIIHVKDSLTDGTHPRQQILEELRAYNEDAGLGCEFFAPMSGEAFFV